MRSRSVPGFTAEATLGRRGGHRVMLRLSSAPPANRVQPQWRRPTGPVGPIGLPGQDCAGACLHVCMSFGGGFVQRCLEDCLRTCNDPFLAPPAMTRT